MCCVSGGSIGGRYAITGPIAENRIAPIAPARLAMLYVAARDVLLDALDALGE